MNTVGLKFQKSLPDTLPNVMSQRSLYPVRNNGRLLCPVHHEVQGSAAGFGFIIIPAGFNAPLEFLTGFTLIVIPGLTPNPVFPSWIPGFAGMTASELM